MFTEHDMLAPLVLAEVRERLAREKINAELRIEADALKVRARGRPEVVVDLPHIDNIFQVADEIASRIISDLTRRE